MDAEEKSCYKSVVYVFSSPKIGALIITEALTRNDKNIFYLVTTTYKS